MEPIKGPINRVRFVAKDSEFAGLEVQTVRG